MPQRRIEHASLALGSHPSPRLGFRVRIALHGISHHQHGAILLVVVVVEVGFVPGIEFLHASQRGGRKDISTDSATINKGLSVQGFREIIGEGSEGDEGFYAFENQMSHHTFEFSEIIFNLKIIDSAAERLLVSGIDLEEGAYERLISLSHIIRRIEANGAGYDESKRLCQFIWEMFAGWNWADGQLDYDPVEKAFEHT